ncbi:hypothetical protein [Metamycoplasma hominis]|uniref:hypothetical protein n=1 Tax=Metamycoplasma hominis TaxID=2098 RepID=UPI00215D58C4|nr:hypothetical protein [Metamycoplasma hominis]
MADSIDFLSFESDCSALEISLSKLDFKSTIFWSLSISNFLNSLALFIVSLRVSFIFWLSNFSFSRPASSFAFIKAFCPAFISLIVESLLISFKLFILSKAFCFIDWYFASFNFVLIKSCKSFLIFSNLWSSCCLVFKIFDVKEEVAFSTSIILFFISSIDDV